MTSESNKAKINSVKTNLQIAWIFAILVNVGVILALLFVFILPVLGGLAGGIGGFLGGLIVLIIPLIIILVFWIPSWMVMKRAGRLYNAAKSYDVHTLKANNSIVWAVIALIFTGVIPGILLIVSNGPISELDESTTTIRADSIDKLERLKNLLDKDAITKEEFEEQKKKLMDSGL